MYFVGSIYIFNSLDASPKWVWRSQATYSTKWTEICNMVSY